MVDAYWTIVGRNPGNWMDCEAKLILDIDDELKCALKQNLPVVCSAFNLIIIRTAQHRAEGIEMGSSQHTTIVFKRPGNIPVDTVLDIRGETCSAIDSNIESA